MMWAMRGADRELARPGLVGLCPICRTGVRAKCGEIVSWHWAHAINDCDAWSEPESEWHRNWKARFPKDWQEVVVERHRADIKTPHLVIELQSSSISVDEIRERERFYGNMVWIIRGEEFIENLWIRRRDGYVSFRWRWPRKCWWFATKPLVIDLGGESLLAVKRLHNDVPCGGWGHLVTSFAYLESITPEEAWTL